MRVERLGGDKIRFFLTLDDLADRGIDKEELWRDIPKVHELFHEMMQHAETELGFEVAGPVAVEVFALPTQGVVVVVTRGRPSKPGFEEYDYDEGEYELQVRMGETDHIIFRFADLEDLIQAAIRMSSLVKRGGRVFARNNAYYLVFGDDLETDNLEALVALLSEFGEASTLTAPWLEEYAKPVFTKNAIEQIRRWFG
jgi:adapter protein MecA 1/2